MTSKGSYLLFLLHFLLMFQFLLLGEFLLLDDRFEEVSMLILRIAEMIDRFGTITSVVASMTHGFTFVFDFCCPFGHFYSTAENEDVVWNRRRLNGPSCSRRSLRVSSYEDCWCEWSWEPLFGVTDGLETLSMRRNFGFNSRIRLTISSSVDSWKIV